jgi:hypothetical protein
MSTKQSFLNKESQREKRAIGIAQMGLVKREGDRFRVLTPSLRGHQVNYEVWRDESGKVKCSCLEFEENVSTDTNYRCEHILAVKHTLLAKQSSSVSQDMHVNSVNANLHTDSPHQHSHKVDNHTTVPTSSNSKTSVDLNITRNQYVVENNSESKDTPAIVEKMQEANTSRVIKEVQDSAESSLIKDIETAHWQTIAAILDRFAPSWSHSIGQIAHVGDFVVVIAGITIDNIRREGIGTGIPNGEVGLYKAEQEALKRAASKFSIVRNLFQQEAISANNGFGFAPKLQDLPKDPVAKSMAELITPTQLATLNKVIDSSTSIESEFYKIIKCKPEELSKKAAFILIDHLRSFQQDESDQINQVVNCKIYPST